MNQETYQCIIDELSRYTGSYHYWNTNNLEADFATEQSWFAASAKDIAERVRKAVASDPCQWFWYDMNGEEIHLGDMYHDHEGHENRALGFNIKGIENRKTFHIDCAEMCRKIETEEEPDTQSRIDANAELYALDYCRKYGLVSTNENETTGVLKTRHLLERQRRLFMGRD